MKIDEPRSLYRIFNILATGLALAAIIGVTIYVFYVFLDAQTNIFTWHPLCMTLGFVLLMASAILALSPDNLVIATFPSLKKSSRFIHAVLQGIGLISIIVGFATIIVYKNENGSNHFVSYHAITGLVTVICSFLTCAGGLLTYFAVNLKDIIKPSYNKIGHGIFGIFTFSLGIAAEGTGFFTSAFEGVVDSNEGVQIACTVLISLASLTILEGAIKSTYSRLQRIF